MGELVDIAKGRKPSNILDQAAPGSSRLIQIGDLRSDEKILYTNDRSGVSVGTTDICIAWDGANAGTVGYDLIGVIGSTIARLRPREPNNIVTPYLGRFLQAKFRELNGGSYGATIPHVSRDRLLALKLPIPHVGEQNRITAMLDKADGIRARRRAALTLTDNFVRAAFDEMFGDLAINSRDWPTKQLGELLSDGPQNGLYRHSSDYGSGTPILRIDSFYNGAAADLSSLKRVRIDSDTLARWSLRDHDIVINRVNSLEYLGKSALIRYMAEPTVFESNMMRMSVKPEIEPLFILHHLQNSFVTHQIRSRARTAVNQSSINQTDVCELVMRVPPKAQQTAYRVLAERAGIISQSLSSALSESDSLYASLADRAFNGEL